jgi:Bacteriophage replication gene A protein (GPA)
MQQTHHANFIDYCKDLKLSQNWHDYSCEITTATKDFGRLTKKYATIINKEFNERIAIFGTNSLISYLLESQHYCELKLLHAIGYCGILPEPCEQNVSEFVDEKLEKFTELDVELLFCKNPSEVDVEHLIPASVAAINEKELDYDEKQELIKLENRRLRRRRKETMHSFALHMGVIGFSHGIHRATPYQTRERWQQNVDAENFIKNSVILGQNGEVIPMLGSAFTLEKSNAEKMAFADGIAKLAQKNGMQWAKVVKTLPGKKHPNPANGNNKWDGTMPREAFQEVQKQWDLLLSALTKHNIKLAGIWTRETNLDSCPHQNFMFFLPIGKEKFVEEKFHEYMGRDGGNIMFEVKEINEKDPNATASFANYIFKTFFKYITKNIDGNPKLKDESLCEQTVASACGFRRFGFFGIPPLTQWRKLRASSVAPPCGDPHLTALWSAARNGDAAEWIELSGGLCAKGKNRLTKTLTEKSGKSRIATGVAIKATNAQFMTKTLNYFKITPKEAVVGEIVRRTKRTVRLNQRHPREVKNLEKSPLKTNQTPNQKYPSRYFDVLIN